jgi:hypothetical protein
MWAVDQQDRLAPTRDLVGQFDAVDPVIDQTALAQYKRRIAELESEIDQAHERGDGEAAAVAQEELDALITQLTAAYGLGGRSRRTPDHVERARKAVSRRLRDAITRIAHAHPRLGRHLDASIRTGAFCSYQPERDTVWAIENPCGLTIDPTDWDCCGAAIDRAGVTLPPAPRSTPGSATDTPPCSSFSRSVMLREDY